MDLLHEAESPVSAWAGAYTLPNSRRSPALARMLVRQALANSPAELIETAELLVSELVTNAIRHAETALVLRLQPQRTGIRVSVEDTSGDWPVLAQRADAIEDHGRGLQIVNALACSWGCEPTSAGKQTWFEV